MRKSADRYLLIIGLSICFWMCTFAVKAEASGMSINLGASMIFSETSVQILDGWKSETSEDMIYSGGELTIFGIFTDAGSGQRFSVYYYKQLGANCVDIDTPLSVEELDRITNWKTFDTLELVKAQICRVYLKVVDAVGDYTYFYTPLLILDHQEPIIEKLTLHGAGVVQQDGSKLYQDDVRIHLKIMDPLTQTAGSALKSISFRVSNMGILTQQEVLDVSSESSEFGGVYEWEGDFLVESERNNSNDVKVCIEVEDMAGNITTKQFALKIDITQPVIYVSYDNNLAQNESYFSADRTATIVIEERNFRAEDVEIAITHSQNHPPVLGGWVRQEGAGNGDHTRWTTTISYQEEGEYTFHLSYCDLAGNPCTKILYGDSKAPQQFTIDKTKPVILVQYDNLDASNERYYAQARTACITVTEENLDPKAIAVAIEVQGAQEGGELPKLSEWSVNKHRYYAEVVFEQDGTYALDITVKDKAGNESEPFAQDVFCIDRTPPEIVVEGLEEVSANRGAVSPKIICRDKNYEEEGTSIVITDIRGEEIDVSRDITQTETGIFCVYANIPEEKAMDGWYQLQVRACDRAGNASGKTLSFSLNRYGSSYGLADAVRSLNHGYMTKIVPIIFWEENVNTIEETRLTLFRNGEPVLLEEEKNYMVKSQKNPDGSYRYTYTIFADNFEQDGAYQIMVRSRDAAGNLSDNNMEGKEAEISFGVDTIAPDIILWNLESQAVYEVDQLQVQMRVRDNFALQSVEVYLDGDKYQTWDMSKEQMNDAEESVLSFTVEGDSVFPHKVQIRCLDEAGNEAVEEISAFYVGKSPWIGWWKNRWFLFGSTLFVIGTGIFLVRRYHKKKTLSLSDFRE